MKKFLLQHTNLIIFAILSIGFLMTTLVSYSIYGDVIKKDLEAISQLTLSNIYSDIDSEITKPVFVSLTMANDIFLKNWLEDEEKNAFDSAAQKELIDYLAEYKRVYGYDSFSVISAATFNYYHFDGVKKKISRDDAHDVWYFNFIDKNVQYAVNVDMDEANHEVLTAFIDSRIEGAGKKLLGVVGVGLKMTKLQDILKNYLDKFGVESFIADKDGVIKVHIDDTFIRSANMHDIHDFGADALKEGEQWYKFRERDVLKIVKYVPVVDSYLVVMKDTKLLRQALEVQVFWGLVIICLVAACAAAASTYIVNHYKKFMTNIATIDELTSLPNRRAFTDIIDTIIKKHGSRGQSCFFILDVDNFKDLNDQFGHPFGDQILREIGQVCLEVLGSARNVFRLGGDEFCGIVHGSDGGLKAILEKLRAQVANISTSNNCAVSISIGVAKITQSDTTTSMMKRADKALYESKSRGRNTITYSKEEE